MRELPDRPAGGKGMLPAHTVLEGQRRASVSLGPGQWPCRCHPPCEMHGPSLVMEARPYGSPP